MNYFVWGMTVFTIINTFAILLMGWDKWMAKSQNHRIPEKILLIVGILGGALGIALGMIFFRHKISKPIFRFFIPLVIVIYWLGLILYLFRG